MTVRLWVLAMACAVITVVRAQQDASLTSDFPKLSAKERSRIAAKETADAAGDQAYQQAMQEAERDFQDKKYEDALAAYEKARTLRPYNVYPKVKIQDLKALLKRMDVEAHGASTEAQAKDTALARPLPVPPVIVPAANVEPPLVQPEPMTAKPPAPAAAEPTRPVAHPPHVAQVEPPLTAERPPSEPKAAPPVGVIERRYQEGRAFVIERTVNDDGERVVYKRVMHTWGHVFFFKDGSSVDERVWKERFNEP